MIISLITFAVLAGSVLLVLSNLRTVTRDIYETVSNAVVRAHHSGQLASRSAFLALWALIFTLSYT